MSRKAIDERVAPRQVNMGRRTDELLDRASGLPEMLSQIEEFPVAMKAEGARVYDVDNIGYIDYTGSGGAAIVGFANQFLHDAVRKVLASGVPDGAHVSQEVDLAESLSHFLPWVGSWWICRNQDDALRAVLPWARRETGKNVVLRLDGGAQFSQDGAAKGMSVRSLAGWDMDRIEAALTGGGSKVAAIIVDPLMTGVGLIPAPEGVLRRLGEICHRCGVLLVVDERVAGFRIDRGGAAGVAELVPDVAVYGGALGGGFPIGVVAFREGLGGAGSCSGSQLRAPHVMSLAAAEAVLSVLKNDTVYERIESRAEQLVDGMLALAERFSRQMVINRVGSIFAMYMGVDGPVDDLDVVGEADEAAYCRLVDALRGEGVLFPKKPGSPAFVSNAHGAKDVDETLAACERIFLQMHQEDMP